MRTLSTIALALTLSLTSLAHAKPSTKRAQSKQWMDACIAESMANANTNGASGATKSEARKVCSAENPYSTRRPDAPAVAKAKAQLKIAKAVERAARAIEACEEAVVIACEDTTERATDAGECSDTALQAQFAQCH